MIPVQYWCVGRNYSEHAQELGNAIPEKPLIFLKSGRSYQSGPELNFPSFCQEVHHELEVVLLLGKNLQPTHWTLGLDLTERKIQNELKAKGHPWELSKTFPGATVLGPWQKLTSLETLQSLEFSLEVNGKTQQKGQVSQMVFSIPELLSYITGHFPVGEGDAIFTGTPSGVGPLKSGDRLLAKSSSQLTVEWSIR